MPLQSAAIHTPDLAPRLAVRGLQRLGLGPLDLSLAAGECACLSGPSGAGKTLLLRAIADLDPHGGELLLDGISAAAFSAPDWRRQVGLLPAESRWWGEQVRDHFAALEAADLAALALPSEAVDWELRRCSAGERQRLALLRLLQHRPRVLLLDEPTANLDPENVQRVEQVLTGYRLAHAAAVLWVSHDPAQIARIADRQLRLVQGQLHPVVT